MKTLYLLLVFLFFNSLNAQWIQQGVDIDGEAAGDRSGRSVSMPDAKTVGIGARFNDGNGSNAGHVRIFKWNGTAWAQKGNDIDGEAAGDFSGIAISMPDSNTVAIGAYLNAGGGIDAGHVRIYEWNGTAWTQKGIDIDGEFPDDQSGVSVSMSDANTVAIGSIRNDGNGSDAGHVRIYKWNGAAWIQKGIDLDGESANDGSGFSVSMPDSNTVAIGAINNNGNGTGASIGHVRIFKWNGTAWLQKGSDLDGEAAVDLSGWSTSMPDSNTVAIGAIRNDGNGSDAGHVRIYKWNGSAWLQKGNDIDGEAAGDQSGRSVSMPDSNTVAIGATRNDGNGTDAGQLRIYEWNGTTWIQKGIDIEGESAGDECGISVSMPNIYTVAVGANLNTGNGSNAGHVRVFRDSTFTTGIRNATTLNTSSLKIYPNPTTDNFSLKVDRSQLNQRMQILNMQGQVVFESRINNTEELIKINDWNAGIYFVRYGDSIKKLVITK